MESKDHPAPAPSAPNGLSIPAVLGLSSEFATDWTRLRGLQYSELSRLSFQRVASNALLAAVVSLIYTPTAGWLLMGGWLIALIAMKLHERRCRSPIPKAAR